MVPRTVITCNVITVPGGWLLVTSRVCVGGHERLGVGESTLDPQPIAVFAWNSAANESPEG